MTRRKTYISAAVLACLGVVAWPGATVLADCGKEGCSPSGAKAAHGKASIGKPAPDFALKDSHGQTHKLSDYKGHIVVLEWTSQQCPYVVDHHAKKKTTQQAYANLAPKGVIWLGMESTHWRKPAENRAWKAKNHIAYPILHDPTGQVGRTYGAKTTPHVFVIHKDGTLVYNGALDDRKGHNFVTTAVGALLAGNNPPRSETKPYGCSVKYGKPVAKADNGGNGSDKVCPVTGATAAPSECPVAGKSADCASASSCSTGKVAKAANGGNGEICTEKKECCGSLDCPATGCQTAKADKGNGNGGDSKNKSSCTPCR